MRLFVGIELPDRIKAAAGEAILDVRSRLRGAGASIDARWIPPQNLHITLVFIGEVEEDRVPATVAALDRPFRRASFDLELGGAGAFPPSGAPRVLWIGVTGGAPELSFLYHEVVERLAPLGYEPDRRPYSAHLTVARVRDGRGMKGQTARRVLAESAPRVGSCRVDRVTLFRSQLSGEGAAYEAVLRVPLE